MKTNIVIDDLLISKAMAVTGLKTKKGTIVAGLKLLLQIDKQKSIKKLKGKLQWEGNIDKMRSDS